MQFWLGYVVLVGYVVLAELHSSGKATDPTSGVRSPGGAM